MHFLLLDSADSRGSLALFRGPELLTVAPHPAEEDFSSWLLPAVYGVLTQNGLSLADLEGYAVCSGPGSFTGLRVGLTTVKAWAEIYRKPIAAVSRLEAVGSIDRAHLSSPALYTAAYFDARRGQVFAALYGGSGLAVEPESVIDLEVFLFKAATACGISSILWKTPDPHLVESLAEWPARRAQGDLLQPIEPPFADLLGALAHRKFVQGQTTDALTLDANYVRRSDAELFWKDHATAVKA